MEKSRPGFHFKLMSLGFKLRDFFSPRKDILKEVGIGPGWRLLDYGCGPGSYIIPAAELVGASGMVYALDIHPLAVRKVQAIASKKGLANVEAVCSDCRTGLPDNSLDMVLLYDTFHVLEDPAGVLEELHRVLKPGGTLSFSDHHMKEDEIVSSLTTGGLFKFLEKGKKTYRFLKKQ